MIQIGQAGQDDVAEAVARKAVHEHVRQLYFHIQGEAVVDRIPADWQISRELRQATTDLRKLEALLADERLRWFRLFGQFGG
ncbi:hypothetical protein [Sphingomonas sp.]|uniref:hypothetical protein n=1 Tax=Sphingomonas sp. TaxID=28214 RepID=UPI003B0095F1